jgi:diguanylate cyclase (GGDEF)-like protein
VLNFRKITPRTFWIVTLTAAAILSAVVTIPQWLSKQERLQVLRTHVGEIAQLAASVVDGDLHRQLLDPANNTPELYRRVVAPLVRFHSADPDIFYVYTMVEREGKAHYVVDTAGAPDLKTPHTLVASQYDEVFRPIDEEADPDWLRQLAAGKTYVYPTFQRDDYGNFLSGHTPIYDSLGHYSGFVGVDFDIQYYLAQEASFRAISIGTLIAALLVSLVIGYLAAAYHYDVAHRMARQYDISVRDELTRLLNRRGALSAIGAALATQSSSYAAILVDVDDLKGINDNYGHAAGDDFLCNVAAAMRGSVRETDICARLGGDEFLIFASGCDLDAATEIARRILARVNTHQEVPERRAFGVSIGIDVAATREADFEAMYRRADQALYRAKAAGRNRYVIFESFAAFA